jgi:hypothetical protein
VNAPALASPPAGLSADSFFACDEPLVDEAVTLGLLRLGGAAFLSSLLDQFSVECAYAPPALSAALQAGDPASFHALLHGLGSAAGNMGARRVFVRCAAWRHADAAFLAAHGHDFLALLAEDLARSLVALRGFAP